MPILNVVLEVDTKTGNARLAETAAGAAIKAGFLERIGVKALDSLIDVRTPMREARKKRRR